MTTRSGAGGNRPDPGLTAIISERRQLINLTYRLLGSLAEAEDAVQETYARWYAMSREGREAIESPGAWLTTVASRICLNLLGSARARREPYVGEWIPEPLPEPGERITGRPISAAAVDPADRVTLDVSVSMAFLVVLESMTPAERVALILHDVFRYSFAEVAEIVGRTPAACRQLASSARRRLSASSRRPRRRPHAGRHHQGVQAGVGGQGHQRAHRPARPRRHRDRRRRRPRAAFLHPIEGAEQIARAWIEIANRVTGNAAFRERTVNGQPGLVIEQDGIIVSVFAFDVAGDRIRRIWVVRNPEKLRPWTTP